MRPPATLLLLLLACSCAALPHRRGRRSPPPPPPGTPTPQPAEPSEPADPQPRPEPPRLLPLDPTRVLWYRLRRDGVAAGRVAFFVDDRGDVGPFLESVGLDPEGRPALRLWRSDEAVWLLPGGLGGGGAYRVWTPEPVWDDGHGRSLGSQELETPAGSYRAQLSEREVDGLRVRHWLAPGLGLVRLEVEQDQQPRLELELEQVVSRGSLGEVPTLRPAQLWAAVQRALLCLDVDGLLELETPALRARSNLPPWDALRDMHPRDRGRPGNARAMRRLHVLAELLTLDPQPSGPWVVEGDLARAPCRLGTGADSGQLVLRRGAQGWRWDDLVRGGND